MTIDSYLTPTQRQDLLKHLSEYGTNYERYLRWASDNGLENDRIYSAAYVRKLFFRKRDIIRKITEENFKKVRRDSTMDRAKRIEALEDSYARLERAARGVPPEDITGLTRVEEQKRRILEAIAKERGEFGKSPEDNDENESNRMMREIFSELSRSQNAKVVNP